MKKIKKILASLLAVCCLSVLAVPVAMADATVIHSVNFLNADGTLNTSATKPDNWVVNEYGTTAVATSYSDSGLHFYGKGASNTNRATLSIPVPYQEGTNVASLSGPIYRETNSSHATWHKLVFIDVGGTEYQVNSDTYLTINDTEDKERVNVVIDTVTNTVTATLTANNQAVTVPFTGKPEVKIVLKNRYNNAQRYVISSFTVTNTPPDNQELGRGVVLYEQNFDNVSTVADAGLTATPSSDVTIEADPSEREGNSLKLAYSSTTSVTADYTVGVSSGNYLLEYEVYDTASYTSMVQVGTSTTAQFKHFGSYGNIKDYNNGGQVPMSKTGWNKMAILYDLGAKKLHLYRNGMYIITKDMTLSSINYIRFRQYSSVSGDTVYFDNIKLTKLDDFCVIGLNLSSQASKDGDYTADMNTGAIRSSINQVGNDVHIANDTGSCTYAVLSAFNAEDTAVQVTYIAAAYSEGKLVDTMSGVYGLAGNSSKSQSFCICDILTNDIDEIKLFVWDGISSMVPLTEVVTIEDDGSTDSSGGEDSSEDDSSDDNTGSGDTDGEDTDEDTES